MDMFETYIRDEKYRDFYQKINESWKTLAESTDFDTEQNQKFHSMIYLPNYYIKASENSIDLPPSWQSYLIVRGLLSNQMFQTAAGIIRNYAALIDSHHFVLYSNRVYWSERSSMPFLALMAKEYTEENNEDGDFLKEILPYLEKDFMWWYNNRRVTVTKNKKNYTMFRYHHLSSGPRPEHYKEDYNLVKELPVDERNYFYSVLRDLDESVFKISSRFYRPGKYEDYRFNMDVTNKIPVELNCLLLKHVEIVASFHLFLGQREPKKFWDSKAKEIATAIHEVLYDENEGVWFDWNLSKCENDHAYYITNLMPLYTIIEDVGGNRAMKAVNYMMKEKIITKRLQPNYSIIPTSKKEMGAQWDYPHGPVLWNLFIIEGLRHSSYKEADALAKNLARVLIKTIYKEFDLHGKLSDHYRVNNENAAGSRNTRVESSGAAESGKEIPEGSSGTRESEKISASALGATIDLLKTFGKTATHFDYDNFKPLDKYYVSVDEVEPKNPAKKLKK